MSKIIDQRVVEMRFDNQHFEKNVHTTMSTLDKLKQSLNLTGASKGLDNLNAAAKNNNIGVLGNAADAVGKRFSAMEIVGITALANLTNSAINTGKRITKALMIDPVTTGFNEYELKMGSIQTIMAGTGEKLETVNRYLNELNKYSDQTIYSFQDMTSNIGKFTNAGVKLEDAVAAIKGVSNEAALSGANANEASRAMYNFAQALSTGSVKLIDWKSIENANMATVSFKEELIKTALELGTIKKKGKEYVSTTKDMAGSTSDAFTATKGFNDSLSHQWMTSNVLIKTLKKYSDTTTELGKKATNAATEVKTFSMMWDTLKEAAQSGWATSWEIVFGDFNEGKKLWTGMANSIGAVIDKMSDARNEFLKGVFWSPWKIAAEKVEEAGISINKFRKDLLKTAGVNYKAGKSVTAFNKALKEGKITREVIVKTLKKYTGAVKDSGKTTEDLTAKLKKFQKIVDQVWHGDFGNGEKRVVALTKAGYKYSEVQNLVNKCVNGYRLKLSDLNDTQLKSIGYTDKQIKAIRNLAKEAETSGTDFNKLIESLSKPSGRELVIETVTHLLGEFSKLVKKVGEAWNNVFGKGNKSDGLYSFIEILHDLAKQFKVTEPQAENFRRIMEGVFSAIKIGWNLAGWGIMSTLKVLNAVLSLFGTDLVEVAADIADLITNFSKWAEKNTIWWGYINNLAKIIYALADGIYKCIKAFLGLDVVNDVIKRIWNWIAKLFGVVDFKAVGNNIDKITSIISKFFDNLAKKIKKLDKLDIKISWDSFKKFAEYIAKILPSFDDIKKGFEKLQSALLRFFEWLSGLSDSKNLGKDIVLGLAEGIKSGFHIAINAIKSLGQKIIDAFCALLGIHSPSTVFIAIGGFIIAGLIYGIKDSANFLGSSIKDIVTNMFTIVGDAIKNGIPYIVDLVKTLGSKILEGLKTSELDLGSLFVVGSMIVVAIFLKKILGILEKLTGVTSPLTSLAKMLDGVTGILTEFQKNVKARRVTMYAAALKSVAISIAILVGAFMLLTKVDTKKVWPALGIMTAIIAEMALVMFAASKMDPLECGKISLLVLAFSVSLTIMASAIRKMASIDFKSGMKAIVQFGLVIGLMAGLMYTYGTFVKGKAAMNIDKAGILIAKIGLSIGLMALVMKLVARLSTEEIGKGLIFIAGITAMFTGIIAISKFSGKNANKAAKIIGKMGVAIMFIAVAVKLIATMSWSDIAKGLVTIAGIEILFAGIIAVSYFSGKHASKAGRMLLGMSAAIAILAVSIKLIAGLSMSEIQKGLMVIGAVMKMFAAFVILSLFVGDNAGKAGRMLFGMAAAIGILVITIKLINTISTGDIAKGMLVIAGFEAMFMAIIWVSKFAGEHAEKAGQMLMKMSLSILILVGAIALLSLIKPEKVKMATEAISSLILCFSTILVAASIADDAKNLMRNVITMTAVVAILAGVIGLLAQLNPQGVLASAAGLSILLLSLSGAMVILSFTKVSPATVGVAALMGLVLAELVGVLWLMSKLDVKPSIQASAGLVILLGGLALVCYLMSGLGPIAVYAAIGIAAFGVLVAELGLVLAALGKLYRIPGLKEFIADGGNLLKVIGTAMGQFIGGIVGGFAQGVTSVLPEIGSNLTKFWNNASGFIEGVKTIDESVAIGMKNLAEAILILTGAGILDALTIWVTGGASFGSFGEQLKTFGTGLKEFAAETEGIDGESLQGVCGAIKSLIALADTIPNTGGLVSLITGDNDFGTFGEQLGTFGKSLKQYADSVSGIENIESLESSVKVVQALANLSQHLPNMGGLWGFLAGEIDMATFGTQLESFGTSLNEFANNLGTFDESKITSIKCAAEAITLIAQAGSEINGQAEWSKALFGDNSISAFSDQLPGVATNLNSFATNLGTFDDAKTATIKCAVNAIKAMAQAGSQIDGQAEWSKKLFGDNGLGAFSGQLPGLASNLNSFATNLGTFDDAKVQTVKCAANAVKAMAEAGSNIDGQSEWSKKLFGDNGLGAFGSEMVTLGSYLKDFVAKLGTFSEAQVATVRSAVNAVKAFAKLANADLINAKNNIPGFGAVLPGFGTNLSSFCGGLPSTDNIDTAVKNIKKIVKMVNDVANAKPATIKTFTDALSSMGKSGISAFTKTFTSAETKTNVQNVVTSFVNKAVEGLKTKKESFKSAAKTIAGSGIDGMKEKYDGFYKAGAYLVEGFCKGISANDYKAAAKAKAMAEKAEQAAKDALGEHSPSKVFYKIGDFAGMGFINALTGYTDKAYSVSEDVASSAKEGLSNAISKVKNFIDNGIDVTPTIAPVLDLSNISDGVRAMNGMLDMGSTIGVSANVGAINTMMNGRNQNGVNDDVVSAINKLGASLGNLGGDTYHIDGVTYDDGSNVSDAVRTLIRAAKVERRV